MIRDTPETRNTAVCCVSAKALGLTCRDWEMILQALAGWRHHTQFRDIYEKVRQAVSNCPAASLS